RVRDHEAGPPCRVAVGDAPDRGGSALGGGGRRRRDRHGPHDRGRGRAHRGRRATMKAERAGPLVSATARTMIAARLGAGVALVVSETGVETITRPSSEGTLPACAGRAPEA